ncbi:MAG: universal stress protein [Desulfobacteraceae bacterium]|jgi:nucleotide-binding universal stress UspA family protein
MERKILLAVEDSLHAKNAVDYAVRVGAFTRDLSYNLFYVQPGISHFLLEEARTSSQANAELKKVIRKNTAAARGILEKFKEQMVRSGVDPARIQLETEPKALGRAKDIIERGQQGLFDAIVVGRRGLTRTQKFFMGSLTANLVEHSRLIPLWVVDGEVTAPGIILAVDGSESSLRAVDHLSFMLSGLPPENRITLFHVTPRAADYCVVDFEDRDSAIESVVTRGDRRCVDQFYAHAFQKFKEAGIAEAQIEVQTKGRVVNVGKAILAEVQKGDYGTLVIGRRGLSRSFFMGSVSRYVIEKVSGRALWIVS